MSASVNIRGLRKRYGDLGAQGHRPGDPVGSDRGRDRPVRLGQVDLAARIDDAGTAQRRRNRDRRRAHVDGRRRQAGGLHSPHLRKVRGKIGMVFQHFNLFPHMTALGNAMEAPLRVQGLSREQARERGVEYLEMVGLGDKLDTYPAQLSGGQKQRVGIARALAMCPEIMLFDEVTSALDPELVGGILQILRDLSARRSMTMIIVTHQMKFAERSSDRTLFFDEGNIVEDAESATLFSQPRQARTRQFLDSVIEGQ